MFYLQEDKRQNKKSSNKPKPESSSDSGDDFRLVKFVYKNYFINLFQYCMLYFNEISIKNAIKNLI